MTTRTIKAYDDLNGVTWGTTTRIGEIVSATFPVNNVIDDFNRADEHLTSGNWLRIYGDGYAQIISNVAVPYTTGLSGISSGRWVNSFNNNQEAYITMAQVDGVGNNTQIGVVLRTDPAEAAFQGYTALARAANNDIKVSRYDGDPPTLIDTISQTISTGDSIGISISGSTIKVYYKVGAGAWAQVGTDYTDATYASGNIGFRVYGAANSSADNFGGGSI